MASPILPDSPPPKTTPTDLQLAQDTPLLKSHRRENLSLVESFDDFLGSQGYSHNTRRAYRRICVDFVDFIRATSLRDVEPIMVRQYLAYLYDRGCSPQTIARETYALKKLFEVLDRAGVVDLSPLRLIRNRRLPKKLPQFHNEAEMEQLIAAGAYDAQSETILEVFYATGIRVSALCNIRLEDVDFNARTILIQKAKGGKQRIVQFGRPAAKAMKAYLNGREDGFLFPSDRRPGHPLSSRTVHLIVNRCSQRAGLGRMSCHKIRHSVATALFNRGVDIMYVKELLGHESIRTTAIYTHVALEGLQRTMEKYHPRW